MEKCVIFGAKSIALGTCLALKELYNDLEVVGFFVSDKSGNPDILAGYQVYDFSDGLDRSIKVFIATPEDTHADIVKMLRQHGFMSYACVDSRMEADLLERYYRAKGLFPSVHDLSQSGFSDAFADKFLEVYTTNFYKDKILQKPFDLKKWMRQIQVGAALCDECIADEKDNTGDNISQKNVNYCELTALYWIWKNKLSGDGRKCCFNGEWREKYYGLFHYRRWLDISEADLSRIFSNDVDVVLPFPTIHEPDISEHPLRYIKESDLKAAIKALRELYPEYYAAYMEISKKPYLYNYNIIAAKAGVMRAYCEWLFPLLEKVEEYSSPKGCDRADRYIGYIGETMLTLYFMHNSDKLKIYHTGRLFLV